MIDVRMVVMSLTSIIVGSQTAKNGGNFLAATSAYRQSVDGNMAIGKYESMKAMIRMICHGNENNIISILSFGALIRVNIARRVNF